MGSDDPLSPLRDAPAATLPGPPGVARERAPVPGSQNVSAPAVPSAEDSDAGETVVALFSGARRSGPWEPPAKLRVLSFFGGCEIDYTESEMLEGESEVVVIAVFGGATIRVPPDIDVISQGIGVFGHFSQFGQRGDDPQPPRLRVRGLSIFGGVEVKGPRKRRRSRRER